MAQLQILVKNMVTIMQTNLPKDPIILLSVINTKLRDHYHNLDALCEDLQISKSDLENTLKGIDYEYDENRHQFV